MMAKQSTSSLKHEINYINSKLNFITTSSSLSCSFWIFLSKVVDIYNKPYVSISYHVFHLLLVDGLVLLEIKNIHTPLMTH